MELNFDSGKQIRPYTLILGQNGTGKSTLLRVLALATAGSDAFSELVGDPDDWVQLSKSEAVIEISLHPSKRFRRDITIRIKRGSTLRTLYTDNAGALDTIDELANSSNRVFRIGYGAGRRLASEVSMSSHELFRDSRAQAVATLFSSEASLHPLEAWAIDLDYRKGEKGLALVTNTLADLLPGVKFSAIDKERKRLLFETEDGVLPLSQLSEGYQNVAAWCGDLLYRISREFPKQKRPADVAGTLLIDEIDLHLHPIWQRKLREFIHRELPNLQIIATTHSPLTAQQCGRNELYYLDREAGRVRLKAFGGEPNRLQAQQVVASPAFGIYTVDSFAVEAFKQEYRRLRDKTVKSKEEVARMEFLVKELSNLPEWESPSLDKYLSANFQAIEAMFRDREIPERAEGRKIKTIGKKPE